MKILLYMSACAWSLCLDKNCCSFFVSDIESVLMHLSFNETNCRASIISLVIGTLCRATVVVLSNCGIHLGVHAAQSLQWMAKCLIPVFKMLLLCSLSLSLRHCSARPIYCLPHDRGIKYTVPSVQPGAVLLFTFVFLFSGLLRRFTCLSNLLGAEKTMLTLALTCFLFQLSLLEKCALRRSTSHGNSWYHSVDLSLHLCYTAARNS